MGKAAKAAHCYTWEAAWRYNASSRSKMVEYSWKIYKRLKAKLRSREWMVKELKVDSQEADNSKLKTQNSELHLNIKEIMP
ncbi:MAG: hypothetical protein HZB80_11750 [Deltaproteobacteria bacterium]|nr:hypothetical protein [Deltaproteobacteria bacterium]